MDTDLALVDLRDAPFTWKTLQAISKTEMVPAPLRGKPDAMLAAILMGRELGLGPMTSMQEIDVIDGRPSPSAALLSALVRRAGHRIRPGDLSDKKAEAIGDRLDPDGHTVVESWSFTYTLEMAERAGLTGKSNWKRYPEAMLWWRAVTVVARTMFPEAISALKYSPEELGDQEWITDVEPVGVVDAAE